MGTENITVEPTDVNLDDFAAELFGQKQAAPEETNPEIVEEDPKESDAQNEDTHVPAADTSETDDEEEEEEPVEAPKPKKNRFQERIDNLIKEREEEKRARLALEQRLNELEKNTKTETPPPTDKSADTGPQPDDKNEDGSDKYALGEFDPRYIKDLMKHTLAEEANARRAEEKAEQERQAQEEASASLLASWNDKLVSAKERYPDFQEVGEQMLSAFEGIDQAYGEYLTNTIMDMEYGPDVFYYLASNLEEADKIVKSGAKKATIALGRLEARFANAQEVQKETPPSRVTNAPKPPEHLNKGSAVTPPTIRGDEKDVSLDEFERVLFKKR